MEQAIFQVDAFNDRVFAGNPAAICPLKEWLSDDLMQKIALENNLSETAFYVKKDNTFHIRWFTPAVEIDLCGHATLAAAFVIFTFEKYNQNEILFHSHRSGALKVSRDNDLFTLDFPTDTIQKIAIHQDFKTLFNNATPVEVWKGKTDYLFVFDTQSEIENIQLDLQKISLLPVRGIIITAKGNQVDFVSRFFAPQSGIDEDPVTGSAHTSLIPYWAEKLNKNQLIAQQISEREGKLYCEYRDSRVSISGKCALYLKGSIYI